MKLLQHSLLTSLLLVIATVSHSQVLSTPNNPKSIPETIQNKPEYSQKENSPKQDNKKDNNKKLSQDDIPVQEPILNFSDTLVKEPLKITQLTILDKSQLKNSGISENDIFEFVKKYKDHAYNFFYSNNTKGGKIIYGVTVKPSLENAIARAKELDLDPNNPSVIDKICSTEPTHCSITSISSFQNKQIPEILINQFEKDMYLQNNEIFWPNYKNKGELKFFFEISLKNTF